MEKRLIHNNNKTNNLCTQNMIKKKGEKSL